jgi:hypothetical protein
VKSIKHVGISYLFKITKFFGPHFPRSLVFNVPADACIIQMHSAFVG